MSTTTDSQGAAAPPVRDLGSVILRNGERLVIRLISPPAPEYTERLTAFLDHKPDVVVRKIRRQLSGAYRGECVDRFFIGEIDGRLAGHIWYGYGIDGAGTANFGEVFTAPEHRRKGVADALTAAFATDFAASPARLALCTAGEAATRIYARHGFRTVIPDANRGPLICLKPCFGSSFIDYAENYYRPGQPVRVTPGSLRHRHDIDCTLRFTHILRAGTDVESRLRVVGQTGASLAGRIGPAWHVANYMEACFHAEDGRGFLTVAALPGAKLAGWAFVLRREAPLEAGSWTFDYELHPAFSDTAPVLIRETLRLAGEKGIGAVFAWCAACQSAKLETLRQNGFAETARVPAYCRNPAGGTSDAVVLRQV